jgi:hypothetical protein
MKIKFEHERLQMLPETKKEEEFCLNLHRAIVYANKVMAWHGDVEFDGKETSGYVFTLPPEMPNQIKSNL